MLNTLRQHKLRKILWFIVLFTSLFVQTQNLFACKLMETPPNVTCCCDEEKDKCAMGEKGCTTPENHSAAGCCNVSTQVDVGLQEVAVTDTHDKTFLLDTQHLTSTIITASEFYLPQLSIANKLVLYDFSLSISLIGSSTYANTRRLRI